MVGGLTGRHPNPTGEENPVPIGGGASHRYARQPVRLHWQSNDGSDNNPEVYNRAAVIASNGKPDNRASQGWLPACRAPPLISPTDH